MAKCSIRLGENGIEIGTVDKNEKWNNVSDVTEQVLEAVRDHLIKLSAKEKRDVGFAWQYDNGKSLILKLVEEDTEKVKEENDEGIPQD